MTYRVPKTRSYYLRSMVVESARAPLVFASTVEPYSLAMRIAGTKVGWARLWHLVVGSTEWKAQLFCRGREAVRLHLGCAISLVRPHFQLRKRLMISVRSPKTFPKTVNSTGLTDFYMFILYRSRCTLLTVDGFQFLSEVIAQFLVAKFWGVRNYVRAVLPQWIENTATP
jgi:hypothetical protein